MPTLLKFLLLSALLGGQPLVDATFLFQRAACNADNCLRVVSGTTGPATKVASTVRASDCMRFQLVTATPATSTTTVTTTSTPATTTVTTSTVYVYTTTVTVTSTTSAPAKVQVGKRATTSNGAVYNSQTTLPAYVSTSCGTGSTALSRYGSACSCAGYKVSTTTAATPIATSTVTATGITPMATSTTTISTATTTTTFTSASPSATPSCTAGAYAAMDGAIYLRQCDTEYVTDSSILGVFSGVPSLEACIEQCEGSPGCQAVNFGRAPSAGADTALDVCTILNSNYNGVMLANGVDSAFPAFL